MEVQVYRAEKDTTSKEWQCQVCLNRARQSTAIWSDAGLQIANYRLEREIQQVTPVKCKHFDKLFQHHERQLLQVVRTKATGPRSTFANKLAQMRTAAEEEVYGVANMAGDKCVEFQVHPSHAETYATTWSIADTNPIVNQLERELHGITSTRQIQLKKELSIRLIEFEVWWKATSIQEIRKTIKQHVILFGYPKMHLLSHISESIGRMGSGDNFTTNISKHLHIGNVKQAYSSTNKVNYIRQMLEHNDQCTGLDCMEETLSHLALEGWYDSDSANVFNLLSATDTQRNTHRAHVCCLLYCQEEPYFRPVSQQVHDLSESLVRRVCRSIEFTSLRDAWKDFGIPNFGQQFHAQFEEDWKHDVWGLVLGYDQNALIDTIYIKLQNGLLYYHQPFHCPTSVERLQLDCKIEYPNANQQIMPESRNTCVQFMDSDLNNAFQGHVPSFPILFLSLTPRNHLLQFQECLHTGKMISTVSKRCKQSQQWILRPQDQEYSVAISTKYKDPHG